jgi:hypothetical protein
MESFFALLFLTALGAAYLVLFPFKDRSSNLIAGVTSFVMALLVFLGLSYARFNNWMTSLVASTTLIGVIGVAFVSAAHVIHEYTTLRYRLYMKRSHKLQPSAAVVAEAKLLLEFLDRLRLLLRRDEVTITRDQLLRKLTGHSRLRRDAAAAWLSLFHHYLLEHEADFRSLLIRLRRVEACHPTTCQNGCQQHRDAAIRLVEGTLLLPSRCRSRVYERLWSPWPFLTAGRVASELATLMAIGGVNADGTPNLASQCISANQCRFDEGLRSQRYIGQEVELYLRPFLDPVALLCTPTVLLQWKDAYKTRAHIWTYFRVGAQKMMDPTTEGRNRQITGVRVQSQLGFPRYLQYTTSLGITVGAEDMIDIDVALIDSAGSTVPIVSQFTSIKGSLTYSPDRVVPIPWANRRCQCCSDRAIQFMAGCMQRCSHRGIKPLRRLFSCFRCVDPPTHIAGERVESYPSLLRFRMPKLLKPGYYQLNLSVDGEPCQLDGLKPELQNQLRTSALDTHQFKIPDAVRHLPAARDAAHDQKLLVPSIEWFNVVSDISSPTTTCNKCIRQRVGFAQHVLHGATLSTSVDDYPSKGVTHSSRLILKLAQIRHQPLCLSLISPVQLHFQLELKRRDRSMDRLLVGGLKNISPAQQLRAMLPEQRFDEDPIAKNGILQYTWVYQVLIQPNSGGIWHLLVSLIDSEPVTWTLDISTSNPRLDTMRFLPLPASMSQGQLRIPFNCFDEPTADAASRRSGSFSAAASPVAAAGSGSHNGSAPASSPGSAHSSGVYAPGAIIPSSAAHLARSRNVSFSGASSAMPSSIISPGLVDPSYLVATILRVVADGPPIELDLRPEWQPQRDDNGKVLYFVIVFTPPEDGDYLVRVSAWHSGAEPSSVVLDGQIEVININRKRMHDAPMLGLHAREQALNLREQTELSKRKITSNTNTPKWPLAAITSEVVHVTHTRPVAITKWMEFMRSGHRTAIHSMASLTSYDRMVTSSSDQTRVWCISDGRLTLPPLPRSSCLLTVTLYRPHEKSSLTSGSVNAFDPKRPPMETTQCVLGATHLSEMVVWSPSRDMNGAIDVMQSRANRLTHRDDDLVAGIVNLDASRQTSSSRILTWGVNSGSSQRPVIRIWRVIWQSVDAPLARIEGHHEAAESMVSVRYVTIAGTQLDEDRRQNHKRYRAVSHLVDDWRAPSFILPLPFMQPNFRVTSATVSGDYLFIAHENKLGLCSILPHEIRALRILEVGTSSRIRQMAAFLPSPTSSPIVLAMTHRHLLRWDGSSVEWLATGETETLQSITVAGNWFMILAQRPATKQIFEGQNDDGEMRVSPGRPPRSVILTGRINNDGSVQRTAQVSFDRILTSVLPPHVMDEPSLLMSAESFRQSIPSAPDYTKVGLPFSSDELGSVASSPAVTLIRAAVPAGEVDPNVDPRAGLLDANGHEIKAAPADAPGLGLDIAAVATMDNDTKREPIANIPAATAAVDVESKDDWRQRQRDIDAGIYGDDAAMAGAASALSNSAAIDGERKVEAGTSDAANVPLTRPLFSSGMTAAMAAAITASSTIPNWLPEELPVNVGSGTNSGIAFAGYGSGVLEVRTPSNFHAEADVFMIVPQHDSLHPVQLLRAVDDDTTRLHRIQHQHQLQQQHLHGDEVGSVVDTNMVVNSNQFVQPERIWSVSGGEVYLWKERLHNARTGGVGDVIELQHKIGIDHRWKHITAWLFFFILHLQLASLVFDSRYGWPSTDSGFFDFIVLRVKLPNFGTVVILYIMVWIGIAIFALCYYRAVKNVSTSIWPARVTMLLSGPLLLPMLRASMYSWQCLFHPGYDHCADASPANIVWMIPQLVALIWYILISIRLRLMDTWLAIQCVALHKPFSLSPLEWIKGIRRLPDSYHLLMYRSGRRSLIFPLLHVMISVMMTLITQLSSPSIDTYSSTTSFELTITIFILAIILVITSLISSPYDTMFARSINFAMMMLLLIGSIFSIIVDQTKWDSSTTRNQEDNAFLVDDAFAISGVIVFLMSWAIASHCLWRQPIAPASIHWSNIRSSNDDTNTPSPLHDEHDTTTSANDDDSKYTHRAAAGVRANRSSNNTKDSLNEPLLS